MRTVRENPLERFESDAIDNSITTVPPRVGTRATST